MTRSVFPGKRSRRTLLLAALSALFILSSVMPVAAYHIEDEIDPHPFASEAFRDRHNRTDQPVIDGQKRTWIWGPEPYTEGLLELYAEAPGGMRLVQYFDKSRMEINDITGSPDDLWFVTNGLLVIDMIEGRFQIGDALFDHSPDPANVQVAGDPDDDSDITYAKIGEFELRDKPARSTGTLINHVVMQDGTVDLDDDYDEYGVTAAYRVQVEGIDHSVASVFWEFMNSEGIIYENHQAKTDRLFENPFYATGYPITEAYWVTVDVEGYPQDVLWQCFERRCLTYTPSNEPGWQVETGNVGQHYFQWRYGDEGPVMEPAQVALVALEGTGGQGPVIGCNDNIEMVDTEIQAFGEIEFSIRAALQRLLVTEGGELTNTWFDQDVYLGEVTLAGGVATIEMTGSILSGGVCDDPRIEEQIRYTATQFAGVNDVVIMLNGEVYGS